MVKIKLDECDGLKNTLMHGSTDKRPTIEPGMHVVLCQSKIEIEVEVEPKVPGEERSNFSGKVVKGANITTPPLEAGDIIQFSRENICHITQNR